MRTVVGTMLAGGLLALAGCGGGTKVVTKTVTTPVSPTAPSASAPKAPAAPSPALIAARRAFARSLLAGNAEQASLPGGDAVFAAAAAAAGQALANEGGGGAAGGGGAGGLGPSRSPGRIVSGTGSGEFAVAYTSGNFQRPSAVILHIDASPAQQGSVDWNVICYELSGGIGRLQGHEEVGLPTTKTLPLPAPSHECTASANVQLAKTGSVQISISG